MAESPTLTELRRVRQFLSPNTRSEVDAHLRTGLPLNQKLVEVLRELIHRHTLQEVRE